MIVALGLRAFAEALSPAFRRVLWKSLGLTVALLALVWLALTRLFAWWLSGVATAQDHPLVTTYAGLFAGLGLVVALIYLIPPVSMLVASFFLDEVAETVERQDYPGEPIGRPLPPMTAAWEGLRFALVSLGVNLLALLIWFVPGVGLLAFFAANAILLGREYFELAAGRYRPLAEVRALRARHPGTVTLAGALIACVVVVPFLNLLTPLFGAILMVHVHKRLAAGAPALQAAPDI
ncbi:sulfate transporter family protein [Alsobacter sp. SYSU M60028]|uniref:Sulfate transporter family protein n=1 Tax=Alsobacter ponti TaxID=2962936 RepID=A0ABT1LBK8_9HYPH|nr:sulfate transporter family protein [Alsobacter ponti]MCP8938875.1 sulfate transporter family protein [Alsobacter ponti]